MIGLPEQPLPPNGTYVLIVPHKLFNGVPLRQGDQLPANDPVRQRPSHLRALVSQRVLALQLTPQAMPEAAAPVSTAVQPAVEPIVRPDLMRLPIQELQALCKEHGVNHVGNKSQLRKRLASALDG